MAKRECTKYKGIYKVGKRYYVTYYEGTKKHEKAVEGKLKDALKEKMSRESKIRRGVYDVVERQEKTTFDQLMDLYKSEGDKKNYILQFEQTYRDFFRGRKLGMITRQDLFTLRDKIKTTPKKRGAREVKDSSVNRALAGLRRFFNFAVDRQFMEVSPFPKTPKSKLFYPEKKGLRHFFTEDQLLKIIEIAPDWLKPMILASFYTGMRAGEMLGLRWDYVNLDIGVIHLPTSKTLKDTTGLGQRIVMQKELIDLLRGLPRNSEWVFAKEDGLPYRNWDIMKPFKALLKSLSIPGNLSWKEIRHTTGSLMHIKGVPSLAIKDQLRHGSVKTTENFYIGTDMEYQRSQVEKLSLNKPAEA